MSDKEVFCGHCESYKFDSSTRPDKPHTCLNEKAHMFMANPIFKKLDNDCLVINFLNNCPQFKAKKNAKIK
jgi:hypothetical protein